MLFVASTSNDTEDDLEQIFSPSLIKALQEHAHDEVYGLQANIGIPTSRFDIRAYFGGKDMPEYPVAYKIYMKDAASVSAVRKAQKAFMKDMSEHIHAGNTFIAFGKEGIILDVENGMKVIHSSFLRSTSLLTGIVRFQPPAASFVMRVFVVGMCNGDGGERQCNQCSISARV